MPKKNSRLQIGQKNDGGKLQWHLLPMESVEEIVRVLMFGAQKYAPENWKLLPDAKTRYLDAAYRHLSAHAQGETFDKESGLTHMSHAATSLLFLLHFMGNDPQQQKKEPIMATAKKKGATKKSTPAPSKPSSTGRKNPFLKKMG